MLSLRGTGGPNAPELFPSLTSMGARIGDLPASTGYDALEMPRNVPNIAASLPQLTVRDNSPLVFDQFAIRHIMDVARANQPAVMNNDMSGFIDYYEC